MISLGVECEKCYPLIFQKQHNVVVIRLCWWPVLQSASSILKDNQTANIGIQAIAGVMSIDLTLLMHQDVRATSSGHQTNAVSIELLDIETPGRIREIHPKYNNISVDFTGKEF